MRMQLATTFALTLGLVAGVIARADDKESKRDAQAPETIRGTVAGVTLEGELTIDYKSNRAIESDMTLLTIVGSPVRGESGEKSARRHQRHNVYVIWLDGLYSPASEVFTIARSATLISVVELALLFDMFGSTTPLATVASLLTTLWSPGFTRTTITIVAVADGASVA